MDVTITKLVHACVLVEVEGNRTLVDPGVFSWSDERFDADMVAGLDRILITHEHADHISFDFLDAALGRSNDAIVETTDAVASILEKRGIDAVGTSVARFAAPHERIPTGPGPQNTGFHIDGVVSHPGDSHSFVETMPILAMPFIAPWGSLTAAVDRVRLNGPRYVVPIHDWFLSDDGASFMYGLVGLALAGSDTELVVIGDFETITLEV